MLRTEYQHIFLKGNRALCELSVIQYPRDSRSNSHKLLVSGYRYSPIESLLHFIQNYCLHSSAEIHHHNLSFNSAAEKLTRLTR